MVGTQNFCTPSRTRTRMDRSPRLLGVGSSPSKPSWPSTSSTTCVNITSSEWFLRPLEQNPNVQKLIGSVRIHKKLCRATMSPIICVTWTIPLEKISVVDSPDRNFDRLAASSKFWQPSKFWHVKISNTSPKKLFVVTNTNPTAVSRLALSSLDPLTTIMLQIWFWSSDSSFYGIFEILTAKFWQFVKIWTMSRFYTLATGDIGQNFGPGNRRPKKSWEGPSKLYISQAQLHTIKTRDARSSAEECSEILTCQNFKLEIRRLWGSGSIQGRQFPNSHAGRPCVTSFYGMELSLGHVELGRTLSRNFRSPIPRIKILTDVSCRKSANLDLAEILTDCQNFECQNFKIAENRGKRSLKHVLLRNCCQGVQGRQRRHTPWWKL